MDTKIRLSTIDIVVLMLTVIQFPIIPDKFFLLYRYSIIVILIFRYHKELIRNKLIVNVWLLYTIILSYSTWINTKSTTWVLSAFMLGMQYIVLFCTFSGFTRKRNADDLIRILIVFFSVLIVFNDILLVVGSYDFSNSDESYWVGNKFLVSYYHCLFGCLVYTKCKDTFKKNIATFILVYAALIAAVVQCTTGIVVAGSIIVMLYLPGLVKKLTEYPIVFIAALAVENILIWGSAALFMNPHVVNLMVNVFQKSADMTGRARLYAVTMHLVEKQPLWGYGHNTDIYRQMFGYGNAQNGLFHIITQAGIIGTIVYFCAVFIGLMKKDNTYSVYGLIMYSYAMLIGSMVEINLSTQFIIGIAIVYAINTNIEEKNKHKYLKSVVVR